MKNKIVLITGGSSGIGQAVAMLFAHNEAIVIISYKNNRQGAEEVVSSIKQRGGKAIAINIDVTKSDVVEQRVAEILTQFNSIDILVNNAGRYIQGDEWNSDPSVWEESIKQNLIGAMNVSKYVLQQMSKQKSGVIINIASRYAISGQYDAPAYAAAKAGIVNLTQGQAKYMAPWGRANAISPGATQAGYWLNASQEEIQENSKHTLLQGLVKPEDIADAALFLSSEKARMITGQNILVDGGYSLI